MNRINQFGFEGFLENEARGMGCEVESYDVRMYPERESGSVVHDDGFMHLNFGGFTYSFDIGQEVSSREYNAQANRILRECGVTGRVTGHNN